MRKILIISLVFILSNCGEQDQQLQQDHIGFSGVDTLYFDNGNIMSEDIYENDYLIKSIKYYDTGEIRKVWEAWDPSADFNEIEYRKNGTVWHEFNTSSRVSNFYTKRGFLLIEDCSGSYEDGNEICRYTSYYDNGQLEKEYYTKNYELHGKYIMYLENGDIEYEWEYIDGEYIDPKAPKTINRDQSNLNINKEIDICRCLSEPGNTSWSQKNRYTCRDAISQRLGVENWEEVSLDPKVSEGFDRLANSCGY